MKVEMKIFNVPKDVTEPYIVARASEDCSLWYYGQYESKERAKEVAQELGNGIVVQIGEVDG